jgi:hypothetical protein
MNDAERLLILGFTAIAAYGAIRGVHESIKGRSMSETQIFWPYGGFVWADMVIFGAFWTLTGIISLLLSDWILFLFIISLFWLVRSIGETIYWFLQQFSTIKRNPPERMLLYKLFKNDAVWFVYQIFWQCITVVTIISSLYLGSYWLSSR